jgi:formate dehydrogenase iron-sulfur subunit
MAGWQGLKKAVAMTPADIVKTVTDSGLRGRGGRVFPPGSSGRPFTTRFGPQIHRLQRRRRRQRTFADRMIMEGDPFVLIEGMAIAGIATGATKGFVYIRSEYPHAIAP